jgi:hypothetical protein
VASRKRRPFTGLLLKPIYLEDAKPRGLNAALAQPPDQSDIKAYALQEIYARYAALDKFFSLDSNSRHIWQQRANALFAYVFNIPPDAFQSSVHLTNYLTQRYVPGFSLKLPGEKRLGARSEWDFERSAQLFADIEFLRKNTGKSVSEICKILPTLTKGYVKRWGLYRGMPEGLRKAYTKTKQLFRQDFRFQLHLCGGDILILTKRIDHVQAAIKRHALQELSSDLGSEKRSRE